ncbi:MAG TPA: Fe(2+)-trafficking protein [Thermoanaerobaculia bacterium]|nr:Fe(2+)-trafficking protein [Thermoanaerobaculia bacterium]
MPETTVHCARCGRTDAPALTRRTMPGPLGAEIQEKVCADCWAEWQKAEVIIINELRLNFMDAGSQQTLNLHMREFLFPGEGGGTGTVQLGPGPS